jgi:hypothetical protein
MDYGYEGERVSFKEPFYEYRSFDKTPEPFTHSVWPPEGVENRERERLSMVGSVPMTLLEWIKVKIKRD